MASVADTVQQVKDKLSIVDVVSGYAKLERAGTSLRARCPFHAERTPSFHVSLERGTYHCFGCGVGGDIFSFIQAIEGVDFKGALKLLAERAGVPLVYDRGQGVPKDATDRLYEILEAATIHYQGNLDDAARVYLAKRGLSDATITSFRLGCAGDEWSELCDAMKARGYSERELMDSGLARKNEKGQLSDKFRNRIMFPIADTVGRIVGFSGRTFGEKAHPDAPKYLNTPETPLFHKSRILYAFDRAKQPMRKHNFCILVEGQMDLLLSHDAGFTNTVAVSGTAFTEDHAKLVKRMTENLLLALDSDEAGIKAATRAAHVALAHGLNVKVAALTAGKDPADLIVEKGVDEWRSVIRHAKDIVTFLLDVLEEKMPKKDQFRRAVEMIVLPFLSDVPSPIAREQYVQEIATRLGVSERAVMESLKETPRSGRTGEVAPVPSAVRVEHDRILAFYLWQSAMDSPAVDPHAFAKADEEPGGGFIARAAALDETARERLRFEAERLFAHAADPATEWHSLRRRVRKDALKQALETATIALKQAEARGDEAEVSRLTTECSRLHTEIAKS
jgi:DNA primase